MLVQYFLIIIILFILWRLYNNFSKGLISAKVFLAWLIFWLLVVITVVNPNLATYLANSLGVGRGSDLAIYLSLILIFFLLYKILARLDKLEQNITKIVRQQALAKLNKNESENSGHTH